MDDFERVDPPPAAAEDVMLAAYLDYQRATLLMKVAGLDEEQARRSLVPSGTTLVGLLSHMGYVERWWFQAAFAGLDVPFPWTDEDPDADWRVGVDEMLTDVVERYKSEVRRSREIVASAQLDDRAEHARAQKFSLRAIMIHMIEETARHNGHADILREQLDGTTGE